MSKKRDEAAPAPTTKSHLEALAGRPISPIVPVGAISLFYFLGSVVGIQDLANQELPSSFVTWKNLIFDQATHTTDVSMLDVTGVSGTGLDGKSVFLLTTFVGSEIDAAEPVNFTATVRGNAPSILSWEYRLANSDLEVTVYAWDLQGNPAPNVVFDWRCRFVSGAAG